MSGKAREAIVVGGLVGLLAVEDLSTLYLDFFAQERGYRCPPLRRDGP